MADTLSDPDAEADVGDGRGTRPRTSRWQKLVGIVGVLVVLWVARDTYRIIDGDFGGAGGGGGHGPSPTTPVDNEEQEPGPSNGGGHTGPPAGGHG